jgi:uncharacterized protein (TIGR00255 family)
MLLSMTGYGRATRTFGEKTVTVEVRALNSKMTDIRFKMPFNYKEKEIELRRILTEQAERGKIDMSINIRSLAGEEEYALNHDLFKSYYREIKGLTAELEMPQVDILNAILRLPNIVGSDEAGVSEEEWEATQGAINDALVDFKKFRSTEGGAMGKDLRERVAAILQLMNDVLPYEKERIVKLRLRMKQNLEEFLAKENVDKNRYEQEVLFYLEKIDITEEKVRLEQHCRYFVETMDDKKNSSKGRTLNFITQEIGREVNTLGSKAYSSEIQHLVVQMKDELEKIKELIANLV